jgi:beta-N-acetylhexosaminidase
MRRAGLAAGAAVAAALLSGCVRVVVRTASPTGVAAPEAAVAARPAPARVAAPDTAAWVDSVLATLSLRQRVAQLVWPWVLGDYQADDHPAFAKTLAAVRDTGVGGIIISIGSPVEVAAKLNALQRVASVPLLVGADLEHGAAFRLRGGFATPNGIDLGGATMFPLTMGLGATRDTALAYTVGRVTADEARAVGIHLAFAPVLDVNVNPRNPVIGGRSLGEDPQLVAQLGASFVRGLQDGGVGATAKHFPGHGDTEQNSHLELARVEASRARLDSVELAPFRAAVAAGVRAMMTFHGRLDALDASGDAATLSKPIITGLLREQMGFDGLVVTDALDMNGVLGRYGVGEVCVRALDAGADILLMPSDLTRCIAAVVVAVEEGRLAPARVDASVRRLLREKARAGLPARRTVDVEAVRHVVADSAKRDAARRIAEAAVTLAKDSLQLVPLRPTGRATKVLSITVAPRADLGAGQVFNAELRRRFPRLRAEVLMPEAALETTAGAAADGRPGYAVTVDRGALAGSAAAVLAAADSADVVLVSSYVIQTSTTATAAAPRGVVALVEQLVARGRRPIIVAFGNPYLLTEIPQVPAYLVAWGGWSASQRAAAQALLGEIPVRGLLPASLGPGAAIGGGLRRP